MARKVELEAEVARLSAIVEQLKGRLDGIDGRTNGHGGEIQPHSRRDFVKLAGAAVAGAAGGVLLGGVPAAAADGDNVILGNTSGVVLNDAGHTTSLTATAALGTPTPLVKIIGSGATLPSAPPNGPDLEGALQVFSKPGTPGATPTPAEAIDGYAPGGIGVGVLGASDVGYGVLGESGSGFDLSAFGTGRVFQFSITDTNGNPLAGPPTFQPAYPGNGFPGGEFVRDANSVLWASRATAPSSGVPPNLTYPKAWRRLNSVRIDSEDGSTFFQPARIIDTRNGTGGATGARAANSTTTWGPFPGTNGIPTDAIGIVGNVTVTGFTGQGFLAVFPAGAAFNPNSSPSTMNYTTSWAWANAFTVGFCVGASAGKISIYTGFIATHVIVDVVAYIQ